MNKNGLLTGEQANIDTSMQTASERGRQSDESEIGRQAARRRMLLAGRKEGHGKTDTKRRY